jgi:hypothetical protein
MARKITDVDFLEGLVWLALAIVAIGTVLSVPGYFSMDTADRPVIQWEAERVRVPIQDRCDLTPLPAAADGRTGYTGACEAEIAIGGRPGWSAPLREPLFAISRIGVPLLVLVILALLLRIVRSVRDRDPFTLANARRMTIMGVLIALGGPTMQIARTIAEMNAYDRIEKLAPDLLTERAFELSFLPLGAGMLLIGLAELFRQGARLREDVEGLV